MPPRRFPNCPPPVEPRSERRVYEAADALGPDWLVLHGLPFSDTDAPPGSSDREIDFLFAHPAHGCLVLEVKGGGIGFSAESGRWHSVNAKGARHLITHPWNQAKDNKYALVRKLKRIARDGRTPWITHAVCFPDMLRDELPRDATTDDDITLDLSDLPRLEDALLRAIAFSSGTGPRPHAPGPTGMRLLEKLCTESRTVSTLRHSLRETKRQQVELSDRQYDILHMLSGNPRVAVSGCAGSGKTL
ncbi:MAG: nuclease-related domain-containing protein, partial [Gemmatimonadota bacterium]|nr:nuclease-related domain-containing protein [Gemmatimonadota bacterium]